MSFQEATHPFRCDDNLVVEIVSLLRGAIVFNLLLLANVKILSSEFEACNGEQQSIRVEENSSANQDTLNAICTNFITLLGVKETVATVYAAFKFWIFMITKKILNLVIKFMIQSFLYIYYCLEKIRESVSSLVCGDICFGDEMCNVINPWIEDVIFKTKQKLGKSCFRSEIIHQFQDGMIEENGEVLLVFSTLQICNRKSDDYCNNYLKVFECCHGTNMNEVELADKSHLPAIACHEKINQCKEKSYNMQGVQNKKERNVIRANDLCGSTVTVNSHLDEHLLPKKVAGSSINCKGSFQDVVKKKLLFHQKTLNALNYIKVCYKFQMHHLNLQFSCTTSLPTFCNFNFLVAKSSFVCVFNVKSCSYSCLVILQLQVKSKDQQEWKNICLAVHSLVQGTLENIKMMDISFVDVKKFSMCNLACESISPTSNQSTCIDVGDHVFTLQFDDSLHIIEKEQQTQQHSYLSSSEVFLKVATIDIQKFIITRNWNCLLCVNTHKYHQCSSRIFVEVHVLLHSYNFNEGYLCPSLYCIHSKLLACHNLIQKIARSSLHSCHHIWFDESFFHTNGEPPWEFCKHFIHLEVSSKQFLIIFTGQLKKKCNCNYLIAQDNGNSSISPAWLLDRQMSLLPSSAAAWWSIADSGSGGGGGGSTIFHSPRDNNELPQHPCHGFHGVEESLPVVLVSWLDVLLLQCNDVETNPGPTTNQLTIGDLKVVRDIIVPLTDWYSLGYALKLPTFTLDGIKASHPSHLQAKTHMLSHWLHNDPDASWEKLAEALEHVGHAQLSREVLKKYCSESGEDKVSISSPPTAADLFSIPDIDSHWRDIGARLSIQEETLDAIDKKFRKNVVRCKREMFKEAMKRNLTWRDFLAAFADLGLEGVVKNVRTTMEFGDDMEELAHSSSKVGISKSSLTTPESQRLSSEARSDSSTQMDSSLLSSSVPSNRSRSRSPRLQSLGPTHTAKSTSTLSAHSDSSQVLKLPELYVKSSTQPIASTGIRQDPPPASLPAPPTSISSSVNQNPTSSSLASLSASVSSSVPSQSVTSSLLPQLGLKVFKQYHKQLLEALSNPSTSSILFANKMHSLNLITRGHLYELRGIMSDKERIAKMLEYLEGSIQHLHKNFQLFVACLKSYKEYSSLAETLSRAHYLQLVLRNMQKISSTELNFNAFCHALSDHKLISDSIKQKAMSSQDPHKLFSIIYTELKTEDLGGAFLDGLCQFQNTKVIASQLEDSGISSGKSFDTSTDITLPLVATGTQDLQFSLPESVKKRSQEVESDNFVSAESSLRDRSVDVFHDSLSQGDSSVSTRKDFLSRPRMKSNGSIGRLGSDSSGGKGCVQGGEGDEPHEVQEMGSEGSTPQNHSSRPTTERLLSGDEGSIQSKEQQLHFNKLQELDPSFQQRQREKESEYAVAVKKWDLGTVRALLLEKVVSVDYRLEKNRTALMLAAIENQKEATRLLIKHKASLSAIDVKGYTPLYLAAKYGNYELLRILMEEPGVDVNVKSKLGVPVIVRTSQKGFSVITEFLLENGAQVELSSEQDGITALYAAIIEQQKDVVKILLEHNADVSYVNPKTERTPLEEAVEGDDPEIVSLIMKAESKTKMKSKQLFSAKTPDEIKDLVIRQNAKIDCRNPVGATPLIAHTISGHLDIVKKLIQLKANIDLQDNMGYSALIVASKAGHIELVRLLISSGAILDLKEKDNGYTGLMFAIINVHVPVVKELVLAKANINLRNRDHKSAIDLAKEGKNTEIMEIVKVQSASSSGGDDPFVQLLSNYMSSKAANPRLSSVKTQDSSKSLKSRPNSGKVLSLSTYKPPLTSATPDETSSMKTDLEKCYKRIADLEIRVHDLSIASSMDVSKDEDVSYMDKSRLETEYKKLKEAKKKAEQYAVEAKQTAQRLSAENFKLREDLNKERHFNELTRKTIVKEVEKEMELNAKQKRLELVRQSVFQEKVAERAYQLIESDPSRGTIYQKVSFTGAELKSIIMNESIRMNMFHVVVDGLPNSGKSSLCLRMGIAAESQVPSGPGTVHGLDLYEAALSHSTRSKPYHQWVKFTELKGHDNSAMDMLAVGLLYYLVGQHQVPQSFSLNDIDPTLFDDPEIQNYFVDMCKFLQKISVQFSTEKGTLEKLLTGPFSLVNIFSIFESKPMREILQTIGGQHPNVLLLDLLDINKYDKNTLLKEEDQRYYGSALHHLGACIEAVSYEEPTSPRCIIIGTHRDKVKAEAKVEKQANDIMKLVCSYASDMGVPESVIYPKMICLDTKNAVQCEAVTKSIVDIIDKHKETYEINIPLKFILLRWYLHKTKERFLTRPELIEHARKCGVDAREVDRFLAIFRACGSIISTDIKEEFLHDHFILLPIDFFQDLCKLYTMDRDGTIPREYLTSTKYGVVSDRTLRSLWQGKAGEISVSDFYIRVLDNFGLLADLGNDQYYIPSVKMEYDNTKTPDGDSLIITTNRPYIPLRKQVEFVKYFQSNKELKDLFVFSDAPPVSSHNCCNVTYFKQRDEQSRFPVIRVRFMLHHIEFSVLEKNLKELKTYSLLKTALVDVMNNVGKDWKPFRYTFNICCPNTRTKPKSHFAPFDISSTSLEALKCSTCGMKLNAKDKKLENRQFWIEAAFAGSQQSLVHPEDVLNPKRIQRICRELTRRSTSSNLIRISKLLNDSCFPDNGSNSLPSALHLDQFSKSHRSLDDLLFHSIYTWHCHNVTASKITLANKLMESGYYSEAFSIAPSLYQSTANTERETIISRQAILTLADWWPSEPVELAKILKVKISREDSPKSAVDMCISLLNSWIKNNSGGDQHKKLFDLLEKNDYYPPMDIFQM